MLWEKKWTRNVPSDYKSAAEYLKHHAGYWFPVLEPVKEGRVVRTLTTVLRENLDKELSKTGLKIKIYAGYIFSTIIWNDGLRTELKNMSAHLAPELNSELFNQLEAISQMEIPMDNSACNNIIASLQQQLSLTVKEAAVLFLAMASSYSPSQVNDAVIETTLKHVEPAGVVEIVVWLSVLQLLNRLSSYYTLTKAY